MAGIRTLRERLNAAAPLTTTPGAPVQTCAGGYRVALHNDLTAKVETRGDRWVASVSLGPPPQVNRGDVFAAMLAYNGLWRETGGGRIGLDGLEGNLVLLGEVAEGAEAAALARLLDMLTTVGTAWRAFLARQVTPPSGVSCRPLAEPLPLH